MTRYRAELRSRLISHSVTRALIKRSPDIVDALASLLVSLSPLRQFRQRWAAGDITTMARAKKKGPQLVVAVLKVERLLRDPDLARLLTNVLVTNRGDVRASDERLVGFRHVLAALRTDAEGIVAMTDVRVKDAEGIETVDRRRTPPGRPRDIWRGRLSKGVARILLDRGERVTKTRPGGLFARVLSCAFAAAGEDAPVDMFDVISDVVDAFRTPPRWKKSSKAETSST